MFVIWNENQLMSLFYSYIAGSLHVTTHRAREQRGTETEPMVV